MDYHLLEHVVKELSLILSGARLDRVLQGADRAVYLRFRTHRRKYTLLISPKRNRPRMHLVGRKPEAAVEVHPLVLHLRSRLTGARLEEAAMLNQDRIVVLRFLKEAESYSLVFELTGSSANLFFCDSAMCIVAMYHPAPAPEQGRRLLLPGCVYEAPVKKEGVRLSAQDEAPVISPNEYAEQYYGELDLEERVVSLRSALRAAVGRTIARTQRRLESLLSDIHVLEQGAQFRMNGEVILANIGNVKPECGAAELAGPAGAILSIALDPRLTAAQNAERYFKKYKKAKSGLPLVHERRRATQEELSVLESSLGEITGARDLDALLRIQEQLAGTALLGTQRGGRDKKHNSLPPGIKRVFIQDREVFIGRNAAGNDAITTKLARPHDLWLHAEGLPGSHVLVRNTGGKEVPENILLAAASLAALHSRGRGAGKVPVAYCEARYVSKPRGAKPGFVVLLRRKSVLVEPRDASRS